MRLKKNPFLAFVLLAELGLCTPPLFSQESDSRIEEIRFEGLDRIQESEVREAIESKKGDLYHEETLSSDLERIYGLGHFENIALDVTEIGEGRYQITFILTEKPLVKRIDFKGNAAFKEGKLKGKIKTEKGEPFDLRQMKEDGEELLEFYREEGYADARVEAFESREEDGIVVTFFITEGSKIVVAKVNFVGALANGEKELRKRIETKEGKVFEQEKYDQDIEKLENFYKEQGFLRTAGRRGLHRRHGQQEAAVLRLQLRRRGRHRGRQQHRIDGGAVAVLWLAQQHRSAQQRVVGDGVRQGCLPPPPP